MIEFDWNNPNNYGEQKVYYYNCRLNKRVALLSGPFLSAKEAEATADFVAPAALQEMESARMATFGVAEMKAPGAGEGRFNHVLPAHLARNLAIATKFN